MRKEDALRCVPKESESPSRRKQGLEPVALVGPFTMPCHGDPGVWTSGEGAASSPDVPLHNFNSLLFLVLISGVMAKPTQNWGAFLLELVGSLVFLWTLFVGVESALPSMAAVWGTANGGIWLPFFVGVAVVASVALFFLSFANLGMASGYTAKATMMAAVLGGVTLAALTWGSMAYLAGAVIGFALAYLGSGMSMMSAMAAWKEAKAARR